MYNNSNNKAMCKDKNIYNVVIVIIFVVIFSTTFIMTWVLIYSTILFFSASALSQAMSYFVMFSLTLIYIRWSKIYEETWGGRRINAFFEVSDKTLSVL